MKGLFNINSKFGHMLNQLGQLILLSFYWILFSLPIFTMGAATCAMYTCCRKMLQEEEGKLFPTFQKAFKDNFRQGCIMGVVTLVFILVVAYCTILMFSISLLEGTIGTVIGIVYLLTVVVVLAYLQFVTAYIARFQDTLKTVLRNCVYMCLMNFNKVIRLGVQFVIAGLAFYFLELIRFLPILMMLLPSGYCMISTDPLEKVFRQYLPKDEEPEEEDPQEEQ